MPAEIQCGRSGATGRQGALSGQTQREKPPRSCGVSATKVQQENIKSGTDLGSASSASRPCTIQRHLYDLPNQLRVAPTRLLGRHGKFVLARKPGIGIGLNQEHFAVSREPHVNSAVVWQLYSTVRGKRRIREFLNCFFVQVFCDFRFGQLVRAGLPLEFYVPAGDFWSSLGELRKI